MSELVEEIRAVIRIDYKVGSRTQTGSRLKSLVGPVSYTRTQHTWRFTPTGTEGLLSA